MGKIAERIVMNELESRGYRTTDLNKDGLSANSDILAAKSGKIWQIQVKGATNKPTDKRWWIQYGHCNIKTINRKESMFNKKNSFYRAQYAALVAIRSPKIYRIFMLPVAMAERATNLNLNRSYRVRRINSKRDKKPGKVWVFVEKSIQPRKANLPLNKEQKIIQRYENAWNLK